MLTNLANLRILVFTTLLIATYPTPAFSTELKINLSQKMADGKLYIEGASNLPEGTKLGITLSNSSIKYSAQDYEVFVDRKGIFTSAGFTNRGKPLYGNFNVELITYFNRIWNSEAVVNKLKTYSGQGVVNNENIEIAYTFNIGPSSSSPSQKEAPKNPQHSVLAYKFCYSLQSGMLCKNLDTRVDTEAKIEKIIGGKVRGKGKSKYNSDCMAGIRQALKEEKNGLCSKAWSKYGCDGSDVPNLLQESPFLKHSRVFCEY